MKINLPIVERLSGAENILIAGMGGGFDVFCGLPLYFDLRERGFNVHLANLSFSFLPALSHSAEVLPHDVYAVTADVKLGVSLTYFPERHFCRWMLETQGEGVTVWCVQPTGVRPLTRAYEALTDYLSIDALILVDGGVDSLMQGDEAGVGTLIEDLCSLFAVAALEIPTRLIASIGFGAELHVSHYDVLHNIADFTMRDAFLGSCSLTKQMDAYQRYEAATLYTFSRRGQPPSVINASIISAVRGHYGDYHLTERTKATNSKLYINPLMAVYWFFDLPPIARRHPLRAELRYTETVQEALVKYQRVRAVQGTRPRRQTPFD